MMKISAVVVTYNRKKLLYRCISSLLEQTKKLNSIIIIDNLSSDGTEDYLKKRGLLVNYKIEHFNNLQIKKSQINNNKKLVKNIEDLEENFCKDDKLIEFIYVKMNSNLGGAGGFNFGVDLGYNLGNDWLWLMDDDGYPSIDCLNKLFKKRKNFHFINPLVLNELDNNLLSFSLYDEESKTNISTKEKSINISKGDYIIDSVNPFNGTFISKELIEKIGFPMKEMFIWGDELEYTLRAKKYNYQCVTLVDSHFFHPESKVETITFLNRYQLSFQTNDLKNYCDFRNKGYLLWRYNKKLSIKYFILYSLYFLSNFKIREYIFYLNATYHGLFKIWGKELQYLND